MENNPNVKKVVIHASADDFNKYAKSAAEQLSKELGVTIYDDFESATVNESWIVIQNDMIRLMYNGHNMEIMCNESGMFTYKPFRAPASQMQVGTIYRLCEYLKS